MPEKKVDICMEITSSSLPHFFINKGPSFQICFSHLIVFLHQIWGFPIHYQ